MNTGPKFPTRFTTEDGAHFYATFISKRTREPVFLIESHNEEAHPGRAFVVDDCSWTAPHERLIATYHDGAQSNTDAHTARPSNR